MINLELYRIFYVVANVGNITKASEILHISQPAVTKQIKNLEQELNTPLFIRTKKGVLLNECGKKIFKSVKQSIELLNDVENDIKEFNTLNIGTIKIGTSTTMVKKYLYKYIEIFHNKYPNIIVDIDTDPTKELINKLKDGRIDLIIGKFSKVLDNELNYQKLGETKYIFIANKKYYNINNISIKDIINYPILLQKNPSNTRISADEYFSKYNIHINPLMNIASSNLLIEFVKLGYGIGYVTELYVKKELKDNLYKINIIEDTDITKYGIMTLKNNILTKKCSKFIECIKNN